MDRTLKEDVKITFRPRVGSPHQFFLHVSKRSMVVKALLFQVFLGATGGTVRTRFVCMLFFFLFLGGFAGIVSNAFGNVLSNFCGSKKVLY
jgi:hypothetical protein